MGASKRASLTRSLQRRAGFAELRLLLCGLILATGLWVVMAFRLPSDPDIQIGQPSPVTLKSPRSTSYVSDIQTEAARARAASSEENRVYNTDRTLPILQRDRQEGLLAAITRIRSDRVLAPAERARQLTQLTTPDVALIPEQAQAIVEMSDSDWETVVSQTRRLYSRAVSDNNYNLDANTIQQIRDLYLPLNLPPGLTEPQEELITLLVSSYLVPNSSLDVEATQAREAAARAGVAPVQVRVLKDELVIQEGRLVTDADMEKLQALGLISARAGWPRLLGYALIAGLLALVFSLYVYLYQPTIWPAPRSLLVIVGLMLATGAAAKLLLPAWRTTPYAFPMAAVSMLLVVLFNSHLALVVTVLLAIVMGILGDQLFGFTVVSCFSGMIGIFCVRRLERSTTFLLAGAAVALTTFAAELAFWLNGFATLRLDELGTMGVFSAVNGGLAAVIALGFLNPLGRAAGVVTPMQLLELAHPTQPLLRRLVREAPGTYYHSISVSNLAEAAAEAVGGDALLLRVGAYYHDIGKMIRPYFFTDNQIDRSNVHDELDPHTSVEIIIDHVREGVKMAEQARLPKQIIDFIRTHHGTSIAGHFYQEALRREDAVDIKEYTYPGPKPQTKDQAILMLADSVEATVRSKSQAGKLRVARLDHANGDGRARESDGQTVEELVGQIIDSRMRSGQLDESPITLNDVALIKRAFVTTLQGIYHPRVEYNQPTTAGSVAG